MSTNEFELAKNGLGVGIGLVIMFFAAEIYHWHGYMKANPSVGKVSTSAGFTPFYITLFIIGTTIGYIFFVRGFASILDDS